MAAKRTQEEMEQLVRTISHDMRANYMLLESSFVQLKGVLDRLLNNAPAEELNVHVEHVEACLRESKKFLNDLAWLGQTGHVEMEPSQVELAAVVDEVLFEQRDLIARRGLEVEVQRPLPVLWCNRNRLKQIVTNLIRNAIHHGCDRKSPRLSISPCNTNSGADSPEGSGTAAFQIRDNGPGIDARFQHDIFLPGRRLAGAHAEGSGMGLAIVKRIVEHYGGSVCLDPDERDGTTFVICLPEPSSRRDWQKSPKPDIRRRQLHLDGRHDRRPGRLHGALSPRSQQPG